MEEKKFEASCYECCVTPAHFRCGLCASVYYCSKQCQIKSWQSHSRSCVPNVKRGVSTSSLGTGHHLGKMMTTSIGKMMGADANQQLMFACRVGRVAVIRELITEGAVVNAIFFPDFISPLMVVAECGQGAAAKVLIEAGALVNFQSKKDRMTPLMLASQNNHVSVVDILLENNANVNLGMKDCPDFSAQDMQGYFSSGKDPSPTAKQEAKAAFARPANRHSTCLLRASEYGHVEICEKLLKSGANVNAREQPEGKTSFSYAVDGKFLKLMKALLAAGADVNVPTHKPGSVDIAFSPLFCAVVDNHKMSIVDAIIAAPGIDLDFRCGGDGCTALHKCCYPNANGGNLAAARALVAAGASVNLRRDDGVTPILLAVEGQYTEIVKLLLSAKCELHHTSSTDGSTALVVAVCVGNEDIVKLLLEAGADPQQLLLSGPLKGSSAIDVAQRFGKPACVKLLQASVADRKAKRGPGEGAGGRAL